METSTKIKNGKTYQACVAQLKKQYKGLETLVAVYIEGSTVLGCDYINKDGLNCIASGTAYATKKVEFK